MGAVILKTTHDRTYICYIIQPNVIQPSLQSSLLGFMVLIQLCPHNQSNHSQPFFHSLVLSPKKIYFHKQTESPSSLEQPTSRNHQQAPKKIWHVKGQNRGQHCTSRNKVLNVCGQHCSMKSDISSSTCIHCFFSNESGWMKAAVMWFRGFRKPNWIMF